MDTLTSKIAADLKSLAYAYVPEPEKKIYPVHVFLAVLQLIFTQPEENKIVVPDSWKLIPGLDLDRRPSAEKGLFRLPSFPKLKMFDWFQRVENHADEPQKLYPLFMTLLTMQNEAIDQILKQGHFDARGAIEPWIQRVTKFNEAHANDPRSATEYFEFGFSLATFLQRARLTPEIRKWISQDRSLEDMQALEGLLVSTAEASHGNPRELQPETKSLDILLLALTIGIMATVSWKIDFSKLQPNSDAWLKLRGFLQK